jgi:hypothetical protein
MTTLVRVDPLIFLHTPLGMAEAHFVCFEGVEVPKLWCTFQVETKENWWWPNDQVRLVHSISAGRDGTHTAIFLDDHMKWTLGDHILRHKLSPFYTWADQYFRGNAGVRSV